MNARLRIILAFVMMMTWNLTTPIQAQRFLIPSDTLHNTKVIVGFGASSAIYAGFSYGLYTVWYKDFVTNHFQFFNDFNEWKQMDKFGHIQSAYFQTKICYQGAKWAGMDNKNSLLTGALYSTLFQTTIEVMDGFSPKWGFSWWDMAANTIGTSVFLTQQHFWKEQKILIKISSWPSKYPDTEILSSNSMSTYSLRERGQVLYGEGFLTRYLKDYNAQIYWLSFNPRSLLNPNTSILKWLNLAIGFGADNLYGGFTNEWQEGSDKFFLDPEAYPRIRRFYLSMDVDFEKIRTRSPFLKSMLSVFNIFKMPAPTIGVDSNGVITFYLFR